MALPKLADPVKQHLYFDRFYLITPEEAVLLQQELEAYEAARVEAAPAAQTTAIDGMLYGRISAGVRLETVQGDE